MRRAFAQGQEAPVKFLADLHIHSKFSMATSRDADLEHLAQSGLKKGLNLIATGDFTHPIWFSELQEKLVPAEDGLFQLRPDLDREVRGAVPSICAALPLRFILSVEISTIYKWAGKTRKVHHVIYAKSFEEAQALRSTLSRVGNIASDGRPILGLSSRDLLDAVLNSGQGSFLIPAHIWTPWFSAMGSKSGFDSIADCYVDLSDHIFAVETGLSSDPEMNWRVSHLDGYRLISNSDAHSPAMLGREANVFDCELNYDAIRRAIATGEGFGGTLEFFPEEGKYHLDGHRNCGLCLTPEETKSLGGRCPKCGGIITVGVQSRVEELASRPSGFRPKNAAGFQCIIPLPEVLSEILQVGVQTKKVKAKLEALVHKFGPELSILREVPLEDLNGAGEGLLAQAVERLRGGKVHRKAGFDGEFGQIRLFEDGELKDLGHASMLFSLPSPRTVENGAQTQAHPWDNWKSQWAHSGAGNQGKPISSELISKVPAADPKPSEASLAQSVPAVLAPLDEDQRRAASVTQGSLIVVAGPGTGKTGTLTRRLAHLILHEGVEASSCLAVTFTRKATREMRDRLKTLLGEDLGTAVRVHTFHALCLEILREDFLAAGLPQNFQVVDGKDKSREVQALWAEAFGNDGEKIAAAQRDLSSQEAAHWHEFLATQGRVDLSGIVFQAASLLAANSSIEDKWQMRLKHISVDEFQDIDAHQYALVNLLSKKAESLCAIGDPDQAIYGFRGSDVGFFLKFAADHPGTREVHLTRNYRSLAPIVEVAKAAIAPSSLVPNRALSSARPGQESETSFPVTLLVAEDEAQEAEAIAQAIDTLLGGVSLGSFDQNPETGHIGESRFSLSDVAILYRTDAQALALQEALFRRAIPFEKSGHDRLLSHRGVRQLFDRLLLDVLNGSSAKADEPSVTSVSSCAQALLEEASQSETRSALQEKAKWIAEALELLGPLSRECTHVKDLIEALQQGEEASGLDETSEKVRLMTMHASKGLEFPVVFVAGCDDGLLPLRFGRSDRPSSPATAPSEAKETLEDEERRLFFVAITRAQERLILTRAKTRHLFGQVTTTKLSGFLAPLVPQHVKVVEVGSLPGEKKRRPKARQLKLF